MFYTHKRVFKKFNDKKSVWLCSLQKLSQAGPSKATAGLGETFLRAPKHFNKPLWKKIFESFWKWYFLAYFVFLADGGAPKRRGARGSLPPTPPSRRACSQDVMFVVDDGLWVKKRNAVEF